MSNELTDADSVVDLGAGPRPDRWRLWIAAGLAVAVVAGGATAAMALRGGGDDELPRQTPEATFRLENMKPGKTEFSLGAPNIVEAGKELRIISVKAAYSPNVEYLGAFAVWPRDHGGITFAGGPGFPAPSQKAHHPIDAVIPAAETAFIPAGQKGPQPVTVTLGFRLLSGAGAVNGVTIVYKVDGATKREHFRYAVTGCVKPEPCDYDDRDFNTNLLRRYGLVKD